jgi:hypothetical protein
MVPRRGVEKDKQQKGVTDEWDEKSGIDSIAFSGSDVPPEEGRR